jgi:hypothetical protein
LTYLNCRDNYIEELDVAGLTNLTHLDCSLNQIEELDVARLTELTTLRCYDNQIEELDVSALTNLETLICDGNPIAELDVSANGALNNLRCGNEGDPPLTVWVDSGRTLGNGSGLLNITAVRTEGLGSTTFDPIAERNTTVNGVTVWNRNLSNGRITWDTTAHGGHGGYALTTDPTDAGLYFLFGSVAGIFSGIGGANQILPGRSDFMFDTENVAWSPVDVSVWSDIPVYDDYPAEVDAAYHTAANVKAGKGDPCRLVGLDLAAIKDAADTDAPLTPAQIDNGIWRLPTNSENEAFTVSYTWKTLDGVNGMGFPGEDTFLPAAGFRSRLINGWVESLDSQGFYWSSTAYSDSNGYYILLISSAVYPPGNAPYASGISVRCVRQ